MLKNEYFIAKIGVDTAENEPDVYMYYVTQEVYSFQPNYSRELPDLQRPGGCTAGVPPVPGGIQTSESCRCVADLSAFLQPHLVPAKHAGYPQPAASSVAVANDLQQSFRKCLPSPQSLGSKCI